MDILNLQQLQPLALLVATVVSFAFGALWYSPLLFLERWCHETGLNPENHIDNPGKVYGLAFVFNLLSVFMLTMILGAAPTLLQGVLTGALLGLLVVMASMGINYQFAGRSGTLLLIDGGFHAGRLSLAGLVLGVWPS